MRFNKHYDLKDRHSFLSASRVHWINYDLPKLERTYENHRKAQDGVEMHEIAARLIEKGITLADTRMTLNAYVNDAVRFRMSPEVPLYYSDNAFGTADAIGLEDQILRIHDLKTGLSPGKPEQLMIYAAYFCLEYRKNPYDLEIKLRIYQGDEIFEYDGEPEYIKEIMDKIVSFSRHIDQMREVLG